MELCKYCDIVFTESKCPLCEAYEHIEHLTKELESAESEIQSLTDALEQANASQS